MSRLKTNDKTILEKVFQMGGGYVLDFTDRTMGEFFKDNLDIDIYIEKYNYNSGSKANYMRGFWTEASDGEVGKLIIEIIDYIENKLLLGDLKEKDFPNKLLDKAKKIGLKLLNGSEKVEDKDEIEFLEKDFNDIEEDIKILDKENFNVIEQRIKEVSKCIKNDIPLSAIFLIGSTLEGILIDLAEKNISKFINSKSSPKDKKGKTINIEKWRLGNLIDVSYNLGYIKLNTKKFSHDLRDFRNFIHPREQKKIGFNPDIHSAKISFQVLKSAIEDIKNNK